MKGLRERVLRGTPDSPFSHYHLNGKLDGQTLFQSLNQFRIEKACVFSRKTLMPISEIASKTGFENISFFNRKFKELMGMTPMEYRKRF